jgi:hypothetical protein
MARAAASGVPVSTSASSGDPQLCTYDERVVHIHVGEPRWRAPLCTAQGQVCVLWCLAGCQGCRKVDN